jgi:hypothetical protein
MLGVPGHGTCSRGINTRWRWLAIWDFRQNGISCAWLVGRNCVKRKMGFTQSQDLNSANRENKNRVRIGRIAFAP